LLKSLPMVIVGLAIFSSGVFAAQAAATVQTGAILPDWFWRRERWPGCVALLRGVSLASLWLARISSRPLDQAKRYGNSILGYQVRSS